MQKSARCLAAKVGSALSSIRHEGALLSGLLYSGWPREGPQSALIRRAPSCVSETLALLTCRMDSVFDWTTQPSSKRGSAVPFRVHAAPERSNPARPGKCDLHRYRRRGGCEG